MLMDRLISRNPFSATLSPHRWPAWSCRVTCLVCAICLGGPVLAQTAQYPLEDTFRLQSRSTATKTIYLDFDGHVTTGTEWNDSSTPTITTAPYSFEGNAAFSSNELTRIQEIWERVAECFSPFDINVTTKAPPVDDLINSGGLDTRWGVRVAVGVTTPDPSPLSYRGKGGGANINDSFSWDSDTPVYIFPQWFPTVILDERKLAKAIADTIVHEVGHTLGLNHDGSISPVDIYYRGHGSGPTGWAPHMGLGYTKYLVQWSKGEYRSADNQEDDLARITTLNGFGYRPDDYASSRQTAGAIGGAVISGGFSIDQRGVIEQRTDSDWFKITAGAGTISLSALGGTFNTMLDIQMDLYDASGKLLVSSNPATAVTAQISQAVAAGTYFVRIDGVGNGDPLTTGYTDYGSLGNYRILGSYVMPNDPGNVTATYSAADKSLTLTGDTGGNGVTVTYSSQSRQISVQGTNGTRINGLVTIPAFSHTGPLKLAAVLDNGHDSITVTGADLSTADITLGNGNDIATFTLCNVNILRVYGGAGVDSLVTTSSTIGRKTVTNVP